MVIGSGTNTGSGSFAAHAATKATRPKDRTSLVLLDISVSYHKHESHAAHALRPTFVSALRSLSGNLVKDYRIWNSKDISIRAHPPDVAGMHQPLSAGQTVVAASESLPGARTGVDAVGFEVLGCLWRGRAEFYRAIRQ